MATADSEIVDQSALDERFMHMALAMARRGLGVTAPNPAVGAIIVDPRTCRVIARGCTQPGGRPHAETEALKRAGERARGATMYVTLEPCSHHGRTPPCADALIAAGIARVVCALKDPDPRVSGKGLQRLKAAGIEVVIGTCEKASMWQTAGHVLRMRAGRPFVQLKIAVAADGRIAPGDGHPRWVTSPEARAEGHKMRARTDAIIVGRGTVLADNPMLTCRLPGLEARSPTRIVLASQAAIPVDSALVKTARQVPVHIITGIANALAGKEMQAQVHKLIAAGAQVWPSPAPERQAPTIDLNALLRNLAGHGFTRVLVEGGPKTAAGFLAQALIDEVHIFRGAKPIGAEGIPAVAGAGIDIFDDTRHWRAHERRQVGPDTLTIYRPARHPILDIE
jgi:diaminohydroxyphosphoribosylaminopyrimidine deaminase/5-amino-6-(5-phosphoribosylamino)uracil reductase